MNAPWPLACQWEGFHREHGKGLDVVRAVATYATTPDVQRPCPHSWPGHAMPLSCMCLLRLSFRDATLSNEAEAGASG